MSTPTLADLFENLHEAVESPLRQARTSFGHSTMKGDASEDVWLNLLRTYLPERYRVSRAVAVDSKGAFSKQLDIVVYDRQYTPFIFRHGAQLIVPAEAIYAIFEVKQELNAGYIKEASDKVESVRNLHRTSVDVIWADGLAKAKMPKPILGGILSLASVWKPPLDKALRDIMAGEINPLRKLDLGCVASHGIFSMNEKGEHEITPTAKASTTFIFELITRLQALGTVTAIDIRAYAKWLK